MTDQPPRPAGSRRRPLLTPTDVVGRQSCYDCGAPLGWDATKGCLICTRDHRHAQNEPHPDFQPRPYQVK